MRKIDLLFDEKYKKKPNINKKILYFLIDKFNILLLKNIDGKIVCILPYRKQDFSNRKLRKVVSKIYKHFKQETYLFSFSSNVKCQGQIKKELLKYHLKNIIYIEGKWLFSYLVLMILEYISKLRQIEIKEQKIDILINELSDITYYEIRELAKKVKRLKIITPQIHKFKEIENELYEKEGIAIELSNNMKKSLRKSSLIINIDFPSETFNKYKINKYAIIIQVNQKVKIDTISFNGINIVDCKIIYSDKLQKEFENQKIFIDFSSNILYESNLYRKDRPENIMEQITNDKVKIEYLIGNKGKIFEQEFKNLNQFT